MMPLPTLPILPSRVALALSLLVSVQAVPLACPAVSNAVQDGKQVIVRGRITCHGLAGTKTDGDNSDWNKPGSIASVTDEPDPARAQHHADYLKPCDHYVLEASDGKTYTFAPSDPMIGMFADTRVRERDLQITASLSGTNQLEVLRVQSIRKGKLYDLYYFCNICNITAYSPGPCPCCRRDLEFKEVPASEP